MFLKFKAALLILLLCFQYGCLGIIVKKPIFSLEDISLTLQGVQKGEASLAVEIKNPNRFNLHFKSLEYRFVLEDREAAKGIYVESFEVPALSTRKVTLPLTMAFPDLVGPLKSLILGKDIPYRIEGTLYIKVLWRSIAIPFMKKGTYNIHF